MGFRNFDVPDGSEQSAVLTYRQDKVVYVKHAREQL